MEILCSMEESNYPGSTLPARWAKKMVSLFWSIALPYVRLVLTGTLLDNAEDEGDLDYLILQVPKLWLCCAFTMMTYALVIIQCWNPPNYFNREFSLSKKGIYSRQENLLNGTNHGLNVWKKDEWINGSGFLMNSGGLPVRSISVRPSWLDICGIKTHLETFLHQAHGSGWRNGNGAQKLKLKMNVFLVPRFAKLLNIWHNYFRLKNG
jgi:hypothetical protein